jgi:lysozyme
MVLIRTILLKEEGLSLRPYICPAGYLTIGVGHNMEANPLPPDMQALVDGGHPITDEMAFDLLQQDIDRFTAQAETFPWYHLLSDARQVVVVCMLFQMGMSGFKEFKKMIAALKKGDYLEAAVQMLDSKWASSDSPERAKRMAKIMREG